MGIKRFKTYKNFFNYITLMMHYNSESYNKKNHIKNGFQIFFAGKSFPNEPGKLSIYLASLQRGYTVFQAN